jgi:thiamine biosynthesis protein ThiS
VDGEFMTDNISIHVNGELREVGDGTSVIGLLQAFAVDPAQVAVEVNLEIIPRGEFATTRVTAGDRVEIVHFVGGG